MIDFTGFTMTAQQQEAIINDLMRRLMGEITAYLANY
jgi:hypothetical protein